MNDLDAGSIAGIPVTEWVSLWQDSHDFLMGSPILRGWPDGCPLLEQEALLVQAFDCIGNEYAEAVSEDGNKKRS